MSEHPFLNGWLPGFLAGIGATIATLAYLGLLR